jgi:hypothetical protein
MVPADLPMSFVIRCVLVGVLPMPCEWLLIQRIEIGPLKPCLAVPSPSDDVVESVLIKGRFNYENGSTGRNPERGIMKTIGKSYGRVD